MVGVCASAAAWPQVWLGQDSNLHEAHAPPEMQRARFPVAVLGSALCGELPLLHYQP